MRNMVIILSLFISFPLFSSDLFEILKKDRESGFNIINNMSNLEISRIRDKKGSTLFNFAVDNNDKDLIQLLLSKNIDINLQDELGFTPLHEAVINNNIELVNLLLSKGANPNVIENRGINPLMFSVKLGNKDIFNTLLPLTNKYIVDYSGQTIMHYAVYYNNIDIAKMIINERELINKQNNTGRTPLHYASSIGNIEMVRLLLENGADPNIKDYSNSYRRSALEYATDENIKSLLVSYGAEKGSYTYKNRVAPGPIFYRTDFDSPLHYYGIGFEYYLDETFSLYWPFAYGENNGYKNYKVGGLLFAFHNLFTLWKTNYDKEYAKNNTVFKVLLGLSAIIPEGIYINFYREDYPFLFYSLFIGLAGLDMASSEFDKDFYVSGAVGGRAGIILFSDLRITLFFNLRLTYNTGNGGYEMGAGVSYKF